MRDLSLDPIVVYDQHGKILRWGNTVPADPLAGEFQINGFVSSINSEMVDASVDPPEVIPIPPSPSRAHEFNYASRQWVLNMEEAWRIVRQRRGEILSACDWTQLPDVSDAQRSAWAAYRQLLRDITSQPDPLSIQWPNPPA